MKCPNCNHDNPESNKFCADCGTKLGVMPSMIECSICHNLVPADSKFCPDCGNKLQVGNIESHSETKQWSTLEDFKNGIIICHGITLGKTTVTDLRKLHYHIEKDNDNGLSVYDAENDDDDMDMELFIPATSESEIVTLISEDKLSYNVSRPFWYNKQRVVQSFDDYSHSSFEHLLKSIGYMNEEGDTQESLDDFIESCGYIRSTVEDKDETVEYYISKIPNQNGDYIFIQLDEDNECIEAIIIAYIKSWENYYTGEITTID